jgi:hypothetical protein
VRGTRERRLAGMGHLFAAHEAVRAEGLMLLAIARDNAQTAVRELSGPRDEAPLDRPQIYQLFMTKRRLAVANTGLDRGEGHASLQTMPFEYADAAVAARARLREYQAAAEQVSGLRGIPAQVRLRREYDPSMLNRQSYGYFQTEELGIRPVGEIDVDGVSTPSPYDALLARQEQDQYLDAWTAAGMPEAPGF